MNTTRAFESARTPADVVDAVAASLCFWSDEEFARFVPGAQRPRVECADDVEEWADVLQRHATEVPLLEPDESGRELLVRLFLLASVKLRLLQRTSPAHRPTASFHAIHGACAD